MTRHLIKGINHIAKVRAMNVYRRSPGFIPLARAPVYKRAPGLIPFIQPWPSMTGHPC